MRHTTQQTLKKCLLIYYITSVSYSTVRLTANGVDPRGAFCISAVTAPVGLPLEACGAVVRSFRPR